MLVLQKGLILPVPMYGGSYFFIQPFFVTIDFTGFTEIFHLLSHGGFLVWPHFYDKFLEKYIRLIYLPHFTTTTYGLYHSRYGFRQVHFRHLVLHVRLLCNMIVDIHCDLCIWMAHHILHNFGIDVVFTQSGTSRMTKGMRWNRRHQLRLSLLFFCKFVVTIMESTMGSAIDSISGSTGFSFIKVSFIRDCLQCFFFSACSEDQKRQNECCRFCHREGQPDSVQLE